MSNFINKLKDAVRNFHIEQPGVGPGVGGRHGGIGANDCYTSSGGNRMASNERAVVVSSATTSVSGSGRPSTNARSSTSS